MRPPLIAALISALSAAALIQIFVSCVRFLLASYTAMEISARVCEAAGIQSDRLSAEDFDPLLGWLELCPQPLNEGFDLFLIIAYFHGLALLVPWAASWVHRERGRCAYCVAVILDRRIAYVRDFVAGRSPAR
jgi:hypothetical protein